MSKPPGPYDILFEPVPIGPVTALNRFYAVPHATGHGHLQPNGSIGVREMKAAGGWGVVSNQMIEIAPDSDMANHPMDRLWDDTDLHVHAKLVERIKAHGALSAVELAHGGMRARNLTSGVPVIGPSHLPIIRPEAPIQARAMSAADIKAFRASHQRAARAAMTAGYDIIYVYAAHDLSILSHFLSRRYNQRTDDYGGSLENRARLLREVLQDTKDAVGHRCAVALRFSVDEPNAQLPITHDGEGHDVVEMLAELPDLWDVNLAGWSADSNSSRFSEEGFQLEFTSFVKTVTSKPVVGVGRFTSPDRMVSLIKSGQLDLIGAARPSIADPYLPTKVREGRIEDIRECIGCNICVSCDAYGIPLRCTQNPTIAEEWRRGWHPEQVPKAKRTRSVLIVGAGPAGLECALTLGRAGHHVTLADEAGEPGGRITRESSLLGLAAWSRARDYRTYQLAQMGNVDLYMHSRMDVGEVLAFDAEHTVVATGSTWRRDGVGGSRYAPMELSGAATILTPDDIMRGVMPTGRVLIYDVDHFYMGGVLAQHLRSSGCDVALVTALPEISQWTGLTLEQPRIVRTLASAGVAWHVNWTLAQLDERSATFACSYTDQVQGALEFDTFVMVGARLPDEGLYLELADRTNPEADAVTVTAIGDCVVPGTIAAAVLSGHALARGLFAEPTDEGPFLREVATLQPPARAPAAQ
jgi:dimethylamine/trimethylamine dehydrogenase